ncbi:hypothetical protein HPP92_023696 [Vanilla planifolia]|uniref:TOD1/MUCI70 glycosyltransferase-like domain-containing protein n=1 Tax=Vanilla planifolia TaxID=51239 RepID=A0A835PIY5_VANPL|nr:hypothetical protein HPP92_024038 [Vanilla planifolia]KAG0455908.1 hypothetical protein HPP92_023696 [Vanilla planifolia]
MGWVTVTKPLLFQSKLLCLSLLYLLTTVPLSIYVSFSQRGCLFSSQPLLPRPLYSYPSSYGEHKHALPASRSSCTSPVFFSDYPIAFQEIHNLCRNGSLMSENSSHVLRYLHGKGETFAGNFSARRRRSFFEHRDDGKPLPCGFLREFFVRDSDRVAMERCSGVVVVSAIFGDHDKVRQPKGLGSKTLETVCFFLFIDDSTLKALHAHNILAGVDGNVLGVWRIIRLFSGDLPYSNPAMNGVIPKHLLHRLFPNAKFSIWLDAKLQLTVDPLLLLHSLLISKDADMAVSKHPFNIHTMEEAMSTARWRKWTDIESLRLQMETYCEYGLQPWSPNKLPYTTDVPDTALIARRHGLASNRFSCLLFNELAAFNPRDQLAFAYVRDTMSPRIKINMFEVDVFEKVAVEYRHNLKREEDVASVAAAQPTKRAAVAVDIKGSKCEHYLLNMWGEATDDTNGG